MTVPTYVVTCAELADRTDAVKRHLTERGVDFIVYRGIHGKTWGLQTVHEFDPAKHIPPGHVGLNLTVWALWQHIWLSETADVVCIFEDDVKLPENYHAELQRVQDELEQHFPDWDLCFLGLSEIEPHVWNKVTDRVGPPDSRLCRMEWPFGTHAYLVRRRALPILLDHMAIAQRNLDQQLYERVLGKGLLQWCAILPSLVTQRTFDYVGAGAPEWSTSCVENVAYQVLPQDAPAPAAIPEQHFQGDTPGKPHPDRVVATMAMIDKYSCIFKGEFLEDDGVFNGRAVPLNQCARLNFPCHSRQMPLTQFVNAGDVNAVACQYCPHRKEMSSCQEHERPRLPIPVGHFNPSIHMWQDRLILATRDSWGHSKVALWELTNTKPDWTGDWSATVIGSFGSDHPQAPRLEDPRLFIAKDETGRLRLRAAFNLPDGYPPKFVQVGYVQFHDDLSGIASTKVYQSPSCSVYEKNWSPWQTPQGLCWVYAMKPDHIILDESGDILCVSRNNLPWTGGVMRGGAAPVYHDGLYYVFFHGCLKVTKGNVYTVGCYTFSPIEPHRILKQTTVPLLWPDLPGPDESVTKRYVCWVGGAVAHEGAWHLAIGVDDTFSRIVRIPFSTVESALSDIPETQSGRVTSIRSTAIGTQRSNK